LLLAEKAMNKEYDAGALVLLLQELDVYKGTSNLRIKDKTYSKVDAYVTCLAAYDAAVFPTSDPDVRTLKKKKKAIIETLFPGCNRLSGNAHDAEEKARLANEAREAEKKRLFGN
jgi:hypothetical protein